MNKILKSFENPKEVKLELPPGTFAPQFNFDCFCGESICIYYKFSSADYYDRTVTCEKLILDLCPFCKKHLTITHKSDGIFLVRIADESTTQPLKGLGL